MSRLIQLGMNLAFGLMILGATASAQVVTELHFGTVPSGVQCDEVWTENNIDLSFTSTTSEDCDGGGNCSFGPDAGSLWLFPSRLLVDFGQSYLIYQVEVDVIDYCGIGCTRIFAYNAGVQVGTARNTAVSNLQTLTMDFGAGLLIDSLAVSSCEGQVLGSSIRIESDVVAGEANSFGSVKAQYR